MGNPSSESFFDRISSAPERIFLILAKGGYLRQVKAGYEDRAVVVGRQNDGIVHSRSPHSRPRSLLILFTRPVPNSLLRPCIGSCVFRSPRRTVTWPLPPLWFSNVHPSFASHRLNSPALWMQHKCCASDVQQFCCFFDPVPWRNVLTCKP